MRNLIFITSLLLVVVLHSQGQQQQPGYVIPRDLKGVGYPAHTELTWKNPNVFVYEIYRQDNVTKEFKKIAETNWNVYLDFFGKPVKKEQKFVYIILPKGLKDKVKDVSKFEVTVNVKPSSNDALLDMVQEYTTRYFSEFYEPATGMARERSNDTNGDIVTTGGTGFGIMALIAGAERKFYSRETAYNIIHRIVTFLEKAERFHGAWAHWYDSNTGKPFSFSRYDDGGDLVETAFLVQGLLTAREYFRDGNESEKALLPRITRLWETVEWSWYTRGTDSLYWHWSKNHQWKMNHRIKGHDETLITYMLAASSPTYPISRKVYESSYKNSPYYLNGKTYYGIKLSLGMEYGGPLFFTHYSFLGLRPKGLSDKLTNYFEQNRNHALIQVAYATENPKGHEGYGPNCWGFTSSDDPKVGYTSHHPGTDAENGTISPTAALSSIVYTPKESMAALQHFYFDRGQELFGRYGFYDAFNPGMVEGQQVVHSYLAIDQGPIAVMIENYRSGLLWKLFMSNPEIHKGLEKLDFKFKK